MRADQVFSRSSRRESYLVVLVFVHFERTTAGHVPHACDIDLNCVLPKARIMAEDLINACFLGARIPMMGYIQSPVCC